MRVVISLFYQSQFFSLGLVQTTLYAAIHIITDHSEISKQIILESNTSQYTMNTTVYFLLTGQSTTLSKSNKMFYVSNIQQIDQLQGLFGRPGLNIKWKGFLLKTFSSISSTLLWKTSCSPAENDTPEFAWNSTLMTQTCRLPWVSPVLESAVWCHACMKEVERGLARTSYSPASEPLWCRLQLLLQQKCMDHPVKQVNLRFDKGLLWL